MTAIRMPRARRAAIALLCTGGVLAASGCQGAYDLPLPGGAAGSGPVYRVTVEFADVLDLVPQSSVRVDQVTVGTVEAIELTGWTARVRLRLPTSVKLPDNAVAELKQTSLLGEKYVQLAPPTGTAPTGSLGDGDNIPLARTGRNPEVEEVLSAMSLLLNGGGVAQLKVIEGELNNALRGNEVEIRDLIAQLDTFVSGLDQQKSEIVRAIDNIDKLSAKLAAQKDDIAAILETTPKGLKILADQRRQFTTMLQALDRLGAVGTTVISQSKADTRANLQALAPILTQLNKAGDDLPKSLQLLLTYPFADSTTGAIKGDYTNLHVTADLQLKTLLDNLAGGTGGLPSGPAVPSVPGLPGLPGLPGVPTVPGVPTIPGVPAVPVVPKLPLVQPRPSARPTPTPTPSGGPLCPPICASGPVSGQGDRATGGAA